jgi:hypothetical protein
MAAGSPIDCSDRLLRHMQRDPMVAQLAYKGCWVRAGRSALAARTGSATARERQLTTSLGKTTIMMPCARLNGADRKESEWHSRGIRPYQGRTERVDGALLGTYL